MIKTTNKKIKILDNLELATPEMEEKVCEESIKSLIARDKKFKRDAFSTPVKYLSGDLLNVAVFLSILIEKLDIDFFDENDMLSFKDDHSTWNYNNIQINYTGDDRYKQGLLEQLSLFIDSLDFTRVRLLENELTEDKSVIREYEKKEYEKQR